MLFLNVGTFMHKCVTILFISFNLTAFASAETLISPDKSSSAEEQKTLLAPKSTLNSWSQFTFENDAITIMNKSDDGYSNGLLYSWGTANYDDFDSLVLPDWIRYISEWTYINQGANKQYSIEYGISQRMYTPDDLKASEIVEDDVPYAGTLLWNTKIRHYGNNSANSIGLALGVVGPASLAEFSQKVIHKLIDATAPQGWDNQIDNEPVFRVEGEHIERFYTQYYTGDYAFDLSSYSEAGLGNLRSDIGTGLTMRYGNMLDHTYAGISPTTSASIPPVMAISENKLYWQVFANAYASYVFNDITLDGNTFTDSYSVDAINEQGMVSFGASGVYNNWAFVFSMQRGTDLFEGQKTTSKYGSFTLSYLH